MHTLNDTARFLQAIFPNYLTSAIFANLNPQFHTRDYTRLDATRGCYWSIAAFPLGDMTNKEDYALDVRALVIDDVGTKGPSAGAVVLALGEPTTIVESSAGNFQYGYRLAKPVAKGDWPGFFGGIEALIGHVVPLEAPAAQTLMRLPMGVNTKKGRGGFRVRLVAVNASVELDPDTIRRVQRAKSKAVAGPGEAKRIRDIKTMMSLLPNTTNYHEWIATGERIKALAINDEEGREAWHEWSARTSTNSYDEELTEKKWWTFTAEQTEGGLLLDAVQRIGGAAVEAWWQAEAPGVFDDGEDYPFEGAPQRRGITATPYQWIDPDKLPPRDWLYGKILIRRFISMTVAPGGVGKSSLAIVEALAMVTGQNLLGEKSAGKMRVWLWNLEDPLEETQRRIQAVCLHYGISEAAIGGRLFVDSGRDQKLVVASMDRSGPVIVRPVVEGLVEQIRLREIDVVVIDPFVSCHAVPENDNTAQDMVVKEWGRVSGDGGCAVHLIDHTRKAPSGTEVTTESSRGGKAKTDAARVVRVVNRMSDAEGTAFGVMDTWKYFNTFNDKANMAPPVDRRDWFHLDSISLGNGTTAAEAFSGGVGSAVVCGDDVGVVTRWKPPSPQDLVTGPNFTAMTDAMGDKLWRKDYQAKDKWIGIAAAKALNLDANNPRDRKTIKTVVEQWIKGGLLVKVEQLDDRRKLKDFIKIAGGH